MKISYDAAMNAMYIKFSEKPFHRMQNINDDVNLDFDEAGNVIGIELLYISRYADNIHQMIYKYMPKEALLKRIELARSEAEHHEGG